MIPVSIFRKLGLNGDGSSAERALGILFMVTLLTSCLSYILIIGGFIHRYSADHSIHLEKIIQMQRKVGGINCHIDTIENIYTCVYVEGGE